MTFKEPRSHTKTLELTSPAFMQHNPSQPSSLPYLYSTYCYSPWKENWSITAYPCCFIQFPWQFFSTHLYSWLERGTVRVVFLAKEHNTTQWRWFWTHISPPCSSALRIRLPCLSRGKQKILLYFLWEKEKNSPERACSVTLRQRDSNPSSMFSRSAETKEKNTQVIHVQNMTLISWKIIKIIFVSCSVKQETKLRSHCMKGRKLVLHYTSSVKFGKCAELYFH